MNQVKEYAKAFAAFAAALAAFCAALAADPAIRDVFPAPWIAVLAAVGTAGTIAGVVAAIPNKLTPEQIIKSGVTVGVAVVPEIAHHASTAAQNAVTEAAKELPPVARDAITGISNEVGSVVDRVIRDFQHRTRP